MPTEIVFEHSMPTIVIVLATACAIGICTLSVVFFLNIKEKAGLTIIVLRILFLLLLAWCLLMPMLKLSETEKIRSHFLVLLDTSESMTVSSTPDSKKRWDTAREILNQPWTRALADQAAVDYFAFSSELGGKGNLKDLLALAPDGKTTCLRTSLTKLIDRYRGQNVCGILVLSDGIDTREINDGWASTIWAHPIYTVRIETSGIWKAEAPDVRIDAVDTPRRATVGWDTELKAFISGQGTANQPIEVQLFRNDEMIQHIPIQLPDDGGSHESTFRISHPVTGSFTYTIKVPALKGETHTNDNLFAVTVQVIDTKNRLLYLEGVPRYEYKFLKRALKNNREIKAIIFVRGPGGRFISSGTKSTVSPEISESILLNFKIVILGDLSGEELGQTRAEALNRFVEDGGSLVLLGGPKAWGKNGYAATPLVKIMPMKKHGLLPIKEGEFDTVITSEGRSHPAFLMDDRTTPWKKAPPVISVFQSGELTPGASVLLATDTKAGNFPIIVAQKYGHGKVVSFFTDSMWRWQLNPGLSASHYQRFWNQMLLWLIPVEEEVQKYQLELFADLERLYIGESIELRARLDGLQGIIPENVTVICEIRSPDDRQLPFTMNKQDITTASGKKFPGCAVTVTPEVPGLYTAIATAEINGNRVESSPYSFFVKSFTPESNPRPANISVLTAMATTSNGKFCEVENINEILATLQVVITEEERMNYTTLWNNFAIIICLVGLLVLEWTMRKVKNMA